MRRSLVVAVARNGVMGRKTWDSIGRPLPGRENIVVTHQQLEIPGVVVVPSLQAAWKAAGDADEVSIIGGTSLFRETLPIADRIHLTEVQAEVPGDVFFPEFDRSDWRETVVSEHAADARHAYPFRILVLDRRR